MTTHDACTGCEHDCPWQTNPLGAPFCAICDDHSENAPMTVQELASEAYACFETAKRPDGAEYVRVKDETPDWVSELVYKAHGGDFLPDDWRYATIRSALAFIGDDATEPEDEAGDFADTQANAYTGELIAWLGSNLRRVGYVDDARQEYGGDFTSVLDEIAAGQYTEAREVYELVLDALKSRAS